jgi:hypothetical protein
VTELLTIEEIEAQFPREWVLLTDVESDPGPVVRHGRVYWHGTDEDELWVAANASPSQHIAVLYMGSVPINDGVVFVL